MSQRKTTRSESGPAIKRQKQAEQMQAMLNKKMLTWLPEILEYMDNLTNKEKMPYIRTLLAYTVPRATTPKQKPAQIEEESSPYRNLEDNQMAEYFRKMTDTINKNLSCLTKEQIQSIKKRYLSQS